MKTKTIPFPARLLALRERAGLTRGGLAERAGLSRIHYTRLERGERVPTVATLRKLAAALAIDVSELL